MKYTILATAFAAPAIAIGTLFFGAPVASADATGNAIAHNPGLQQQCAFNPAFAHRHPGQCDYSVEDVASNGTDESAAVAAQQNGGN